MSQTESKLKINAANSGTGSIQKHVRGSTLLLIGRVFSIGINFIVGVLIVRYLSKTAYGAFAYASQVASLATTLAVFGLDKTITRFIPIYQEEKDYNKLFGSILLSLTAIITIGVFFALLAFGLQFWFTQTLEIDQLAISLLLILIFLAPIDAIDLILLGLLAIFANPRLILFRKSILGPGLKLIVVLLLIFSQSSVQFLAIGYTIAGFLGVLLYTSILVNIFKNNKLLQKFNLKSIKFPAKEIFGFSIPMLSTQFVLLARISLVIFLLEYFGSTSDVASFRAALSVSRLNTMIRQSFSFLFMPLAAKFYARKDQNSANDLYWQTAIWIAIFTFPIFIVSSSLSGPLTYLLYGKEYIDSALIMTFLSIGYYVNAALGFNAETLRIYGKIRYTVIVDISTIFISLAINLYLISRYHAVGAGIGMLITMVIHNILNHAGLKFKLNMHLFPLQYIKVYAIIVINSLAVAYIQYQFNPHMIILISLVAISSFIVLWLNRRTLEMGKFFPELLRIKILRKILS
jgi:O-antigen/teichoic acid export membrane protein